MLVPKPADILVSALLTSQEIQGIIFPENLKSLSSSSFSNIVIFYIQTWVEMEVSGETCSYLSMWSNAFWELHYTFSSCTLQSRVCVYVSIQTFFPCFFLLKETVIRDLMILLKRTNFYEKACWKEKKGNSASGPLILSPARSETVLMGREVPLRSVFLNLKIIRRSTRRETSRYNANYGCHNKRMGTWLWRQLEISSEMFWDLQQGCNRNTGFDIKALNDDKQWSIRRTNKEMINQTSEVLALWYKWVIQKIWMLV